VSGPRRRRIWQGGTVALGVALTVGLAQNTTTAAFTAGTGNAGDTVTASGNFCASQGVQVAATLAEDSPAYQANPTTFYGSYASIGAVSQSGQNARSVLRFTLPTVPAHCAVTGAVLRLYATRSDAGASVVVYQVATGSSGWTEAGISWNTLPGTTGPAASGGSPGTLGWQQWTVTTQTAALYATVNSGFLIRVVTASAGVGRWQLYDSKEGATPANRPQLLITWG
jgi:hypothetical protein